MAFFLLVFLSLKLEKKIITKIDHLYLSIRGMIYVIPVYPFSFLVVQMGQEYFNAKDYSKALT